MYNGHRVIDVHGHLSAPPQFNTHAFAIQNGSPATRSGRRFALAEGPMQKSQEDHIRVLDERGIDVELISPRPFGMMHWERPGRWLCGPRPRTMPSTRPARYIPFACLAYEKACELDATLIVHGSCSRDPRTSDNQFGFLMEETMATHRLERSDVFDRFPALRVIVVHCGGALSRFVTRNLSAVPLPDGKLPDGLYFDTCAYDADYLRLAFKQRGLERFAFGTEAPGSGNVVNPDTGRPSDDLVQLFDTMKEVTVEQKRLLYYDNPKKLFPLLSVA